MVESGGLKFLFSLANSDNAACWVAYNWTLSVVAKLATAICSEPLELVRSFAQYKFGKFVYLAVIV